MAREQTRSRRDRDDGDDDDRDRGRGRGRDRDDDDRGSQGGRDAKGKGKAGSGGSFSWSVKDAVSGGLVSQGRWRVVESFFTEFDYGGSRRKPATVLLWKLKSTTGGETAEETWTMGEGFRPTKDGLGIEALNGQAGFGRSTKIIKLFESLEDNGAAELIEAEDASAFEDLVFDCRREEMERFDRGKSDRGRGRDRDRGGREEERAPSVLLIDKIVAMPGEKYEDDDEGKGSKGKKAKGGRARADEDDDDDAKGKSDRGRRDRDDDDDDRGRGNKRRGRTDDDADDDGKSAKGKAGKAAKGKAKDDDEDKLPAYHEDAKEALIEALEKAGGTLKPSALEAALGKVLRGNKEKDTIVEYASADTFLELEEGWSFDGKKVELEDAE